MKTNWYFQLVINTHKDSSKLQTGSISVRELSSLLIIIINLIKYMKNIKTCYTSHVFIKSIILTWFSIYLKSINRRIKLHTRTPNFFEDDFIFVLPQLNKCLWMVSILCSVWLLTLCQLRQESINMNTK
jgi:hypothetical protein